MRDGAQTAGKINPSVSTGKTGGNKNKDAKQTTFQEMERTHPNPGKSPPKKKKYPYKPSTLETSDFFDSTLAGSSQEVSMLLSKFAEMLSERASADTAQMRELDRIISEAHSLEVYLKEKKKHLKQTLSVISEKLG